VMKRADSAYPVQLSSATEECRAWCRARELVAQTVELEAKRGRVFAKKCEDTQCLSLYK